MALIYKPEDQSQHAVDVTEQMKTLQDFSAAFCKSVYALPTH
jgi:hypothetical protein